MYSQNDEEKYILQFFGGQHGKFLDIGAFDGKAFSNTYALSEQGWDGVCIEPSPTVFYRLMEIHKTKPNIQLVNAAIDCSFGLKEFYDSTGDALSSFSKEHKKKWEDGWKSQFTKIYVSAIPIAEIFAHFGTDFAFINLDVEAHNYPILMSIPFTQLKTRMICVEHDGHITAMTNHLKQFGFRELMHNGENVIFVR